MTEHEFKDKVVLVTGAGRGLGRAAALVFAGCGAIVAANDINPLSLDELVAACAAVGGQARAYCFDVAKRMPVMALIAQVMEDCGRIDIVVINAAVAPQVSLIDMDEWDWHRTLDVNLSGAFFVIQQAGRVMRQLGGGVMVTIGANPAYAGQLRAAYWSSKAGLRCLTQEAAVELRQEHIRVNMLCPSEVADESGDGSQAGVDMVLYLCSQASAHLTGKVYNCGSE